MGGTVLLVEDEPALRRLIARSLRDEGFSVAEARHGKEALEVFASAGGHIDALVTDIRMPLLSGIELVRELRGRNPALRVLYITAYPGYKTEDDLLLMKPFTRAQLIAAVRELLLLPAT